MKQIFRLFLLILSFFGNAQNETDLYRYSHTGFQGTARFEAMAGAFGALGADLSSSQVNPAGFGRYSNSTAGFSFYGGNSSSKAAFKEVETQSNNGLGGIANATFVLVSDDSEKGTGILYSQFGGGYNRVENFRNTFRYTGQQFESLLDEFTSQAYLYYPEELSTYFPFSSNLAYETGTIQYNPGSVSYTSLLNSGDMIHDRTVSNNGGINEFFLSYSVNYLNKLYVGANWGFRKIKYLEEYTHKESLTDISGTPLRSFDYSYNLTTKGQGSNLKIGAIYLVSEAFRLGLAIHTPTFYKMEETWSASMTAVYADSVVTTDPTFIPEGNYQYRMRNPGKIVASAAYVFGTRGCVDVDVELMDYRHAHFKTTNVAGYEPYNYVYENNVADTVFKSAMNLHIGGEFIPFSGFFVRGGFAMIGQAFQPSDAYPMSADYYFSGGLGIRTNKFSADISYKQRMNERNYSAFYNSNASIKNRLGIATLTANFFF